ncbi:hypothetical protein SNC70_27270 [Escherichia coli]|nr:hypothetical protein [Escherichia coli]HDD1124565.1 hypothetical protein [Escherichia coli]HDD1222835.1 hypothetical protein [Escherichia coli]
MIKKMWRYLRQIDKYELLQQVISVHEVELLRKMMTDSLLGCSVGYVFSKILKIFFLRFIQSEGGMGYYYLLFVDAGNTYCHGRAVYLDVRRCML